MDNYCRHSFMSAKSRRDIYYYHQPMVTVYMALPNVFSDIRVLRKYNSTHIV